MFEKIIEEIKVLRFQYQEEIEDLRYVRVLSKLKDETRILLDEEIETRRIGLETIDEILFRLNILEFEEEEEEINIDDFFED